MILDVEWLKVFFDDLKAHHEACARRHEFASTFIRNLVLRMQGKPTEAYALPEASLIRVTTRRERKVRRAAMFSLERRYN